MTNKDFYQLMTDTFESAKKIAESKGVDYTVGSLDALSNFKEGGKSIGIAPLEVCWVFMNKHYQAITNYVKSKGTSESEPIEERVKDMINYLILFQAIINESKEMKITKSDKTIIQSNGNTIVIKEEIKSEF